MQHNKAIKQDLKNNLIERKNEQNELQNKLSFYRKTENIRMQRII